MILAWIIIYTVDKCGTWKFQVMALRDLTYEATLLQNKLLPNNILGSCDSYCSSNSDCGGFTLCQWCWEKTNPFTGAIYSTCSILPWTISSNSSKYLQDPKVCVCLNCCELCTSFPFNTCICCVCVWSVMLFVFQFPSTLLCLVCEFEVLWTLYFFSLQH